MQKLYLDDLGNVSTNVASDVATLSPVAQIEATEQNPSQTPNVEKGETVVESKGLKITVPDSPENDGVDEDVLNTKIAEGVLKSLGNVVPNANVVPDAPTSLAQAPPVTEVEEDVEDNVDHVIADSHVQQEKVVSDDVAEHTDKDVSAEEDLVVLKSFGGSKSGKTGVGNRLRVRKGKQTEVAAEATKSTKKKKVAAEATKSPKKKMIGPVRRSSRVEIPAKQKKQSFRRKIISLSDSDYDVEEDVPNITSSPKKKTPKRKKIVAAASGEDVEEDAPSIVSTKRRVAGRFIPPNVPDVPMDNVSFHFIDSAAKWKYVYARRIGLERELSDETLECKEVIDLIEQAGLMKTVSGLGSCYAKLVKEFIVNIAEDCDNPLSKEYQKVYVRGKCVEFSPVVINRFLGRKEDGYSEVAITNNEVCKTITANQVKVWPLKGKVPSCMLSVKYAVLNRIGTVNWVPTTHSSHIATGLARLIYSVGIDTE
jgi:hypothetical protein